MGEYALRKSDNMEIKIGTCESMYYIRWDDRDRVRALPNSLDPSDCSGLFWRLPFPDEDNILPGDYKEYNRGLRLWKYEDKPEHLHRAPYCEDFMDEETADHPGTIQLSHKNGLLLNVKCYHGHKLPDGGQDVKPFFNGKSWSLELAHVKNMDGKLYPVVHCRWCGKMWRYDWKDILPYVQDEEMKKRLTTYSQI